MATPDENYVAEILQQAAKMAPMTPAEFRGFCRADLNAGYAAEVSEASKRYFLEQQRELGRILK